MGRGPRSDPYWLHDGRFSLWEPLRAQVSCKYFLRASSHPAASVELELTMQSRLASKTQHLSLKISGCRYYRYALPDLVLIITILLFFIIGAGDKARGLVCAEHLLYHRAPFQYNASCVYMSIHLLPTLCSETGSPPEYGAH